MSINVVVDSTSDKQTADIKLTNVAVIDGTDSKPSVIDTPQSDKSLNESEDSTTNREERESTPCNLGPSQAESTPVQMRRKKLDSEDSDRFEHSLSYEEDSLPGKLSHFSSLVSFFYTVYTSP